jgi:hypothetical protein
MAAFFFSIAIIEFPLLTGSVINSDSDAVIELKSTGSSEPPNGLTPEDSLFPRALV